MLTFPSFLRGPIQASYSREETSRFGISQPASGPYFNQILSDDAPSYFNLSFVFKRSDAMAFAAWLRLNNREILTGAQFEIDLSIEDGVTTQIASFVPDGIPQYTGEVAQFITYSARIMVRKLSVPSEGLEELVIGAAELGGSELLDIIVQNDLPGA
jgi:hypothetical protein